MHIGIIGTGMIGTSSSVLTSGHGVKTTILSVSDELSNASKKIADDFFKQVVDAKKMTEQDVENCKTYIKYTTDYNDLADCDYIWECVLENKDVKYEVYRQIEEHCDKLEVLMSSTSAIAPDDLVKGCSKYGDRMIVAHPINPPHLVPYVELITPTGITPDSELVAKTKKLFLELNRKPVLLKKSIDGFFATRFHMVLLREAFQLAQDGVASKEDIDMASMYGVMPAFMSCGIFEQMDFLGLDKCKGEMDNVFSKLSSEKKAQDILVEKFNEGKLGVKVGEGFYDWTKVDMKEFKLRIAAPWWDLFHWNIPTKPCGE